MLLKPQLFEIQVFHGSHGIKHSLVGMSKEAKGVPSPEAVVHEMNNFIGKLGGLKVQGKYELPILHGGTNDMTTHYTIILCH